MFVSASPAKIISLSFPAAPSNARFPRHICKREGVSCITAAFSASMSPAIFHGSIISSSSAMTTHRPRARGSKVSVIKVSNTIFVVQRMFPSTGANSSDTEVSRFERERCRSMTPLGRPVEPEV